MQTLKLLVPALAGGLLFLGGCAAYNLNTLRSNFLTMDEYPDKSQFYLDSARAIYAELMALTDSPEAAPYPEMKACLKAMETAVHDQEAAMEEAGTVEAEFEKFSGQHGVISDKDPDWGELVDLRSRSEAAIARVAKYTDTCADISRNFNGLMREYDVRTIVVASAQQDMARSVKRALARVDALSLQASRADKKLRQEASSGQIQALTSQSGLALEKITSRCAGLKEEANLVGEEAAKFEKGLYGDRLIAWIGPGLTPVPGRRELKALWDDIKAAEDQMRALAKDK